MWGLELREMKIRGFSFKREAFWMLIINLLLPAIGLVIFVMVWILKSR